jgi:hypothetical protein
VKRAEHVLPRSTGAGRGEPKMYTPVSKCKNDKIKERKKKKKKRLEDKQIK